MFHLYVWGFFCTGITVIHKTMGDSLQYSLCLKIGLANMTLDNSIYLKVWTLQIFTIRCVCLFKESLNHVI